MFIIWKPSGDAEITPKLVEYSDCPVFITPGVCAVDIAFTIVKSIPSPFPCFFIQADIITHKKERRQHFIYLFIYFNNWTCF